MMLDEMTGHKFETEIDGLHGARQDWSEGRCARSSTQPTAGQALRYMPLRMA